MAMRSVGCAKRIVNVWAHCLADAWRRRARAEEAAAPTFNRDIRPILSDRCFPCHGHDPGNRKAELRLDTAEGATDWAIIPGDAENSEVMLRVSSDDREYRMPPVTSNRPPLNAQQIELLRRWIDAGAEVRAALVVHSAAEARGAGGKECRVGTQRH